jgi:hypothetical protein
VSAPDILDDIKADLGIIGTTDDPWLQRRIDGAWARIEKYTARALAAPPASFVDDWGKISSANQQFPVPPSYIYAPRASVFLRYFPVTELVEVRLDGTPIPELADVTFDSKTGKLFSVSGGDYSEDLSARLRGARARITYKAGWAACPPDLYEIVLGVVTTQWTAKGSSATGMGGVVSSVSLGDVGSIELSQGNAFVVNAGRSATGSVDPLLGPYITMLDGYVDHRSLLGWEGQPTTDAVPPPPP